MRGGVEDPIFKLWQQCSNYVSNQLDAGDSPLIQLAPYEQRKMGFKYVTFPILNMNGWNSRPSEIQMLAEVIPGAFITPAGKPEGGIGGYNLHVPIPKSEIRSSSPAPTLETPLVWLLATVVSAGALYMRHQLGVLF